MQKKFKAGELVSYNGKIYYFDSYINEEEALISLLEDESLDLLNEVISDKAPLFCFARVKTKNIRPYNN